MVAEIVAELKTRQQGRGDQAKMRYAEDTYEKVAQMEGTIDVVKSNLLLLVA